MAGAQMEFSPQEATKTSKAISTASESIKKQVEELKKAMNDLTWWKGDSKTKYVTVVNKLSDEMKPCYEFIKETSERLTKMSNDFVKAEADLKNAIK